MADTKKIITAKDIFLQIAEQSKENRKEGKENERISLTKKYNVEFTADFGSFQKGDVLNGISELAYRMYNANKVVKEI